MSGIVVWQTVLGATLNESLPKKEVTRYAQDTNNALYAVADCCFFNARAGFFYYWRNRSIPGSGRNANGRHCL